MALPQKRSAVARAAKEGGSEAAAAEAAAKAAAGAAAKAAAEDAAEAAAKAAEAAAGAAEAAEAAAKAAKEAKAAAEAAAAEGKKAAAKAAAAKAAAAASAKAKVPAEPDSSGGVDPFEVGSPVGHPSTAIEKPGEAVGAEDAMRLLAALKPGRSSRVGGVHGDCLRVAFALKHNERLLKAAGRIDEAELMATLYDAFCSRLPEAYMGKQMTEREYRCIDRSPAATVDTLFEMALEDRRDAGNSGPKPKTLPEWLEATLEVTGRPSDVASQSDVLARMRAPDTGWEFARRHDADELVRFLRVWCDAEGVVCADGCGTSADEILRRAHCKGVVFRGKPDVAAAAEAAEAAAAARAKAIEEYRKLRCASCASIDLLNSIGLCGACDPLGRSDSRRVRELFDGESLKYTSHGEVLEGGFRVDFLFDTPTHFVVVEVDDNQHAGHPAEAERARMVAIRKRLGKPTVFVRYNPDDYEPGAVGGGPLPAPEPLEAREKTLVYWVKRLVWTPRLSDRGLEVLYLYFDGFVPEKIEMI